MEKVHGNAKLYRIVKLRGCPEGNLANLNPEAFSAREAKQMSTYLASKCTPQQALQYYAEETETDVSKIVGVVAVTARTFRKHGAEVINDKHPVDPHVKAFWKDNQNYKKMQKALIREAQDYGWQLSPLIANLPES